MAIAAAGFRLRNIKTSLTLGEKLAAARTKQQLSIDQVEEATKIRAKYLRAIEGGRYHELPTGAYPRGFVFTYGSHLGLAESDLCVDWQREAKLAPCEMHIVAEPSLQLRRFFVTPRLLATSGAALSVLTVLCYVLIQIAHLTGGPDLAIAAPANRSVVTVDHVVVSGQTIRESHVEINGQVVQTDQDGSFSQGLQLDPGLNTIDVMARGQNGRETKNTLLVERQASLGVNTASLIP